MILLMIRTDFLTSNAFITMHRSLKTDKYTAFINHCLANCCEILRKNKILYFLKWFLSIDFLQISIVN